MTDVVGCYILLCYLVELQILPILSTTTREFKWTSECEETFQTLKTALTSAPILAFPDLFKDANPFILDTDASGHGIGAGFAQADRDGRERVIQYGSKTLDKAEQTISCSKRLGRTTAFC